MNYQTSTKCSQQPSQCDGVSDNLSQVDKGLLKKRCYKATSPSQSAIEQARFYLSLYKGIVAQFPNKKSSATILL